MSNFSKTDCATRVQFPSALDAKKMQILQQEFHHILNVPHYCYRIWKRAVLYATAVKLSTFKNSEAPCTSKLRLEH